VATARIDALDICRVAAGGLFADPDWGGRVSTTPGRAVEAASTLLGRSENEPVLDVDVESLGGGVLSRGGGTLYRF
jgi:hypothetical protein